MFVLLHVFAFEIKYARHRVRIQIAQSEFRLGCQIFCECPAMSLRRERFENRLRTVSAQRPPRIIQRVDEQRKVSCRDVLDRSCEALAPREELDKAGLLLEGRKVPEEP